MSTSGPQLPAEEPRCGHCDRKIKRLTLDSTGTLACAGCFVPDITQPKYRGATEDFIAPAPRTR